MGPSGYPRTLSTTWWQFFGVFPIGFSRASPDHDPGRGKSMVHTPSRRFAAPFSLSGCLFLSVMVCLEQTRICILYGEVNCRKRLAELFLLLSSLPSLGCNSQGHVRDMYVDYMYKQSPRAVTFSLGRDQSNTPPPCPVHTFVSVSNGVADHIFTSATAMFGRPSPSVYPSFWCVQRFPRFCARYSRGGAHHAEKTSIRRQNSLTHDSRRHAAGRRLFYAVSSCCSCRH